MARGYRPQRGEEVGAAHVSRKVQVVELLMAVSAARMEHHVEVIHAQTRERVDTPPRIVEQLAVKLEGQRRKRLGQPTKDFGLIALDVNLAESWDAVRRDQRIQCRDWHPDSWPPGHLLAVAEPAHAIDSERGTRRMRRRVKKHLTAAGTDAGRQHLDSRLVSEPEAQGGGRSCIRLNREYASAERHEDRDLVSTIRADVEHQVPRSNESPVQAAVPSRDPAFPKPLHRSAAIQPLLEAPRQAALDEEGGEGGSPGHRDGRNAVSLPDRGSRQR